jgi:TonB-dependent receptor
MVQELLAGSNYNDPDNGSGYINPTGGLQDSLQELSSSYALIDEETSALYLQANLDFDRVRLIVGGRYVQTDITSTAYDQDGAALVSDTNEYGDFLPSLNATVELTDDTLMRFSAAEVMRRADFGQLSPTYQFNSDRVLATRGNPALDPYRATQFDIAFEHYFGDGNLVSATIFYKDVASFLKSSSFCAYEPEALADQNHTIFNNICIRPEATGNSDNYIFASTQQEFDAYLAEGRNGILTTTVTNGSSGTVEGFELGYQQSLDFLPGPWAGFGINANYTHSASEDPDGVALEDISENAYNAQLFWEYADFGVRLAYTYRDRFLDNNFQKRVERVGELVANRDPEIDDPTEGNDYRDDLSQLDLAANWDVNDTVSVFAYIYNITAEPTINQSVTGTTWQVLETDRRYTFGVRAKF